MKTKINTFTNSQDRIVLATNNQLIKENISILYKIIEGSKEATYIKLAGYGRSFGSPEYTFEFWGFNSLEEALIAEMDLIEEKRMKEKQNVQLEIHPMDQIKYAPTTLDNLIDELELEVA